MINDAFKYTIDIIFKAPHQNDQGFTKCHK